MDKSSGIFNFTDLNELWSAGQAERAMAVSAASPNYVNNDEARRIADEFLRANNLGGAGAVFYEVISDTISTALETPELAMSSSLVVTDGVPVDWQVNYTRRLTAPGIPAATSPAPPPAAGRAARA